MSGRVILSVVACSSRHVPAIPHIPLITRCSSSRLPVPHYPAIHQTLRFASGRPAPDSRTPDKRPLDRHLRDAEIPYRVVKLVDPATNLLGPPVILNNLLQEIKNDPERRKWQCVELVAERPEPIVKLIDRREQYRKTKERAEKAKEKKTGEKEVQMTWGVGANDLEHKLKKAREALTQGHRVSIVYTSKKGQVLPSKDEMREKIQKTKETLADIGHEWKPDELRGHTSVIYLKNLSS